MEEIIIKQSFRKQFILTNLGITMVFASWFTYKFSPLRFIGIFGMLFFGLALSFIVIRLFRPKIILKIDENGITDNSSMVSAGFVPWDNIKEVFVYGVISEKFIGISLKDEDKFLNEKSMFLRKYLRLTLRLGYPPISITLNSAKDDYDEILYLMELYFLEWENRSV